MALDGREKLQLFCFPLNKRLNEWISLTFL